MKVKLLGFIPIVNATGSEVDQAELLRWLGESILFPTNLLPNDHLHWYPVDHLYAKLNYHYNGLDLFYNITFNNSGEIIQMETLRNKEEKLEE